MKQNSNCVLMMMAQSAIHAGAGSADEVVDLPIQRESASDWPCVYGSSMKGALRMAAEQNPEAVNVVEVFGPDTQDAHLHGGAMLVSDARLLMLPVRSMNGHFKRVTCPALLRRWQRDMARMGSADLVELQVPEIEGQHQNQRQQLICPAMGKAKVVYLEEFDFSLQQDADAVAQVQGWADAMARYFPEYDDEIQATLALVSDDTFRHLCRSAIPVQTRIRLENSTKTVAKGALWYEEYLSPETAMYCTLSCGDSRKENGGNADELMRQFSHGVFAGDKGWLQVGGNETVGMGWFRVQLAKADGEGEA
ncbi:MAG: type III-B CRISPR module RAMP protein Cmr4 [Marinobacterium sp.]|nr:type III-B CRISPR module RAMP protein Cmr4 [Marinobacterium sp.]